MNKKYLVACSWCIPEILEVRRLRQEDHSEFENSLEFEIRTGYWEHFLFILSVGEELQPSSKLLLRNQVVTTTTVFTSYHLPVSS